MVPSHHVARDSGGGARDNDLGTRLAGGATVAPSGNFYRFRL